jgi:hypothetical protein
MSIYTFSQVVSKKWDIDFGGDQTEQLSVLQQTKDGGYIFGGYSESGISGDKTQASRGGSDYWILKANAQGVKQWDFRYGGNSVDELTCLQQTSDGGYIVGGISFSGASGDKCEAGRRKSDYWIVKITSDGIKQWDATFGGTQEDELRSIQQTSDGGYILGGSSISNISEDKTQNSKGGKDFWIVKADANGVKQWDATFGGNMFEEMFSVLQTNDGGYILGGYSLSDINGDKTQHSRGRYDMWIVKTNNSGAKQWDKTFGGADDDWLAQLQQTTDGGYILGGWSWSGISGDKTQATKGDNDYWIIKINGTGKKKWDADFGASSNDYLTAMQQTNDGGYFLGGYSSSPAGGDKTQNTQGGTDYWAVKTDAYGTKLWDVNFGGTDFDFCYAAQQTTEGGYILGGYSSSGIGGDKSQPTKGLNDYWIVKTTKDTTACNTPVNVRTAAVSMNEALLRWSSVKGAIGYQVSYRQTGSYNWLKDTTTNNYKKLTRLSSNTKYEWRVRAICCQHPLIVSEWSATQSFTTQTVLQAQMVISNSSSKNISAEVYPNPVLKSCTITINLFKASPAIITVTDVNGRLVKTISNTTYQAGTHNITFNRESLLKGTYFLQIKTNENVISKKMILE